MIEHEKLDVRTITLGISLLDCVDSNLDALCDKIYRKITSLASNLVATGRDIERDFGIPIVNKRISVTPISLVGGAACKSPEDFVTIAKTLDKAAKEVGVNFIGGYSALVSKGMTAADKDLILSIPQALAQTCLLYTSYMKRLEFKSILSRFDATSMGDTSASSLEDHFTLIRDEKSAAEVFAKAAASDVAGLQLIIGTQAGVNAAREDTAEQLSFSFDENGEVKAGKKAKSGLSPVTGLALCLGEEDIYCMAAGEKLPGEFLIRETKALCSRAPGARQEVWVLDVYKRQVLIPLSCC